MVERVCRFCRASLSRTFANLGLSPIANAFLNATEINKMEPFYPLHAYVCDACLLVQLEDFESPENIFNDQYAYYSSYSDIWLDHAQRYTELVTARFGLDAKSFVVEIASNDGYLLQFFLKKGIPVLGVEPSGNVADAAKAKGVDTWVNFFSANSARKLIETWRRPNLVVGNNVLAHVPTPNDFVEGLKIILAQDGIITMEFPHLLSLMRENQFDTIYHEHFSYFSLLAVTRIFAAQGLRIFDVERLSTHGGSLRIYVTHLESKSRDEQPAVAKLIAEERRAGLDDVRSYSNFSDQVNKIKFDLLRFLIEVKNDGKKVVGYGAPAKGNTLLNFCGIGNEFLEFTVDKSLHKQGMFLPGTRIPIFAPEKIFETRPDYVLILPWNLADEIMKQMSGIAAWGGKFVIPIPHVRVLE